MFRPPGQKRSSAPKVRTGCLTCKTRRVKCDESKPRCTPCKKSSRDCQWKRETISTTSRVLVPLATHRRAPPPPVGLVKPPSQRLHFDSDGEIQYLRAYQDVVHRELSGPLMVSPWFHSVLQACHTEPSILRAVVAIGALNKSWKLAHFATHGPSAMRVINKQAANSHREFALVSYSKALAGLGRLTLNASQPTNLRHILIGSLLVHCLEIFLESPESAFQHSAAGYSLLLDWISTNQDVTKPYKWTSSPNTAIIEDAIFHEHVRLQNDRALSAYSPPLSYHQTARQRGESGVLQMPKEFTTLEEAQDHCELLMHRTTHLIAEIRATIKETRALLAHPLACDLPGHVMDTCDSSYLQHLYPLRTSHLTELHAWKSSFSPLLARLSLTNDTRLVVGSAIQQNHTLNAIVTLSASLEPSEMTYEQYYNLHNEIIALIVRSMKITPHITADLRPVFQTLHSFHYPIANVATGCRDKALREQAITIMVRMSPRDGDMARQRLVFSHRYLITLEESNRSDNGELAEHLRYRIVGTFTHGTHDTFTAVAMREIHRGPKEDIYPSTKRYRWKTWTKEEAASFEVGDVVSDLDGEEAVDHERELELKKWPVGLPKPAWIRWWEVFHELPKTVQDRRLRPVRNLPKPVATIVGDEDAWVDIPEKVNDTIDPRNVMTDQMGGFGAWVPHLNVFPDQDLNAIHRGIYRQ